MWTPLCSLTVQQTIAVPRHRRTQSEQWNNEGLFSLSCCLEGKKKRFSQKQNKKQKQSCVIVFWGCDLDILSAAYVIFRIMLCPKGSIICLYNNGSCLYNVCTAGIRPCRLVLMFTEISDWVLKPSQAFALPTTMSLGAKQPYLTLSISGSGHESMPHCTHGQDALSLTHCCTLSLLAQLSFLVLSPRFFFACLFFFLFTDSNGILGVRRTAHSEACHQSKWSYQVCTQSWIHCEERSYRRFRPLSCSVWLHIISRCIKLCFPLSLSQQKSCQDLFPPVPLVKAYICLWYTV